MDRSAVLRIAMAREAFIEELSKAAERRSQADGVASVPLRPVVRRIVEREFPPSWAKRQAARKE